MYCRSCGYNLSGLGAGSCPECARPFDPADAATFDARPNASVWTLLLRLTVGVVCALITGGAAGFAFRAALRSNHGFVPDDAFNAFLRIGFLAAFATALIAALSRSWLAWIPLLMVGIGCVWAALFLGGAKYFDVWQSMPNPPEEAFTDTGVLGGLILGWLPGVIVELVLFGLCLLVCRGTPALVRWTARSA